MKKFAVDAMGGDNAPQALVEGVNQAIRDFDDIEIVLYGDEAKIKDYLTATERVSIVHTKEKSIQMMSQRGPFVGKTASMVLAAKAMKDGEVDACYLQEIQVRFGGWFLYRWPHQGVERPGDVDTSNG